LAGIAKGTPAVTKFMKVMAFWDGFLSYDERVDGFKFLANIVKESQAVTVTEFMKIIGILIWFFELRRESRSF